MMKQILAACGAAALIMSGFSSCGNRQDVPQPDVYTVTQTEMTGTVTAVQSTGQTERTTEAGTARSGVQTEYTGTQTAQSGRKVTFTEPEQTKKTVLRTNAAGEVILPEV